MRTAPGEEVEVPASVLAHATRCGLRQCPERPRSSRGNHAIVAGEDIQQGCRESGEIVAVGVDHCAATDRERVVAVERSNELSR